MNQEIPDGWNKVKFKELAKQKSVRIDNPGESGFEKYVGLEHLDSGELVVKRYGSTSDVTSTMKLFNKGDILFARRNTYLKRVSVAPFDGVCSGDIIVLEPILDHIVEGFLPIFMQFEPFENKIIALSAGAFSKRIKWKQLAEEDIFLPSIEEQKKIVEIIWSIQNTIEKNERLINTTEMLERGLHNELLTKGIGHKKFKETEIGTIPEEWSIFTIGDLLTLEYGKGLPKHKRKQGNYPVLGSNGIVDVHNEYLLEAPSIIVGRKGTAGQITYINDNCWPIDTTYYVNIKQIEVSLDYAYYFLLHANLPALSQSTGVPGLNRNDVYNILVPLPELIEQKEIVYILKTLNINISNYNSYINYSSNLKKKLTNDYLSGKLLIPKEVL